MIVMWQFEQCPYCQKARRKVTGLTLDCVMVSAPQGCQEKDKVLEKLFDSVKVPAIWDTRTGALVQGNQQVCDYLDKQYG